MPLMDMLSLLFPVGICASICNAQRRNVNAKVVIRFMALTNNNVVRLKCIQ